MIRLGQRLRDERIKRSLSVEDVTAATKIRASFITAIEKGEYHTLPSSSYAQGFVVNYAEFLGFSRREAKALFRREFDESKELTILPERFADPADRAFPRIKVQQTVLSIIFAFLLLIAYLIFSYRDALFNPPLQLYTPKETSVAVKDILVSGHTSPYATVTVNDMLVTLTAKGDFIKRITVFPGKQVITVKAKNRFGRETTVVKEIQVK